MANYQFVLYDRTNTTSKCLLAAQGATITDEINSIQHLQLTIPLDTADYRERSEKIEKFDCIRLINIDKEGDYRSFRIFFYSTEKNRRSMIIEAEDLIIDLAKVQFTVDGRTDIDYTVKGDGKFIQSNATVTEVLTDILERTDYTVGQVSYILDADPQEYQFNHDTCLSALQKIVTKYKPNYQNCGYRRNENGTIDFVSNLARNGQVGFGYSRFGEGKFGEEPVTKRTFLIDRKNLTNIKEDTDAREYCNRLWCFGSKQSNNWRHCHSGIESQVEGIEQKTAEKDVRIVLYDSDEGYLWRYGDGLDMLYETDTNTIALNSSSRTIKTVGSMIENDWRGGVLQITSGELKGTLRFIDANDKFHIALNDKLYFINDVDDIIDENIRLSKKVRPANILGFSTWTSYVESAAHYPTYSMVYDGEASFGTSNEYDNGILEILSGNKKGAVTTIDSHTNTQLFTPRMILSPETDSKYRISARTPVDVKLSIDVPEVITAPQYILKRTVDFGGGLTLGKHPKFRTYVDSATDSLLHLPSPDAEKFSTYQICQIFTSSINSLDHTRSIDIQQFEIDSIQANSSVGDILYPVSSLSTTPTKGDEIEILTLVNSTEITSWGVKEGVFREEGIKDPWVLYREADAYLTDVAEEKKIYKINCIDLWKTDPERYKFDEFEVGDIIGVFDEETQISNENLYIKRKVWKPLTPWVVESLEVDNKKTTTISRDIQAREKIKQAIDSAVNRQRAESHPVCANWDEYDKRCRRQNPPNSFCESEKGNNDGRLRNDMGPITKADCKAYQPLQARNIMPNGTGITGTISNCNTIEWTDVFRLAVDVSFKVSDDSQSAIISTYNEVSGELTSVASPVSRIQINAANEVVPYDTKTQHGCYIQVANTTADTLTHTVFGVILGYDT